MAKYFIFSDASFDPRSRIGIAGVWILADLLQASQNENSIQTKIFYETNCTRLELESILWSFDLVREAGRLEIEVEIFTDCKTAVDLPARRARLESRNFLSQKTQLPLNNADLYQEFFKTYDTFAPKLHWIKGHKPLQNQNEIERIFSAVDKETRRQLRELLSSIS